MEAGSEALDAEKAKASVRARVEHPFYWVKAIFGYRKVRYRGIRKNMNRLYLLLGFANLMRSRSMVLAGQVCPDDGKTPNQAQNPRNREERWLPFPAGTG